MKIDVLKLRIMNCSKCNRDTLMVDVKLRRKIVPFMLFCSGCGSYFEMGEINMMRSKPKILSEQRQEGPTGPET